MSDEPVGISDVEIQQLEDRLAKDSRSVGPKTVLALLERLRSAEDLLVGKQTIFIEELAREKMNRWKRACGVEVK